MDLCYVMQATTVKGGSALFMSMFTCMGGVTGLLGSLKIIPFGERRLKETEDFKIA